MNVHRRLKSPHIQLQGTISLLIAFNSLEDTNHWCYSLYGLFVKFSIYFNSCFWLYLHSPKRVPLLHASIVPPLYHIHKPTISTYLCFPLQITQNFGIISVCASTFLSLPTACLKFPPKTVGGCYSEGSRVARCVVSITTVLSCIVISWMDLEEEPGRYVCPLRSVGTGYNAYSPRSFFCLFFVIIHYMESSFVYTPIRRLVQREL